MFLLGKKLIIFFLQEGAVKGVGMDSEAGRRHLQTTGPSDGEVSVWPDGRGGGGWRRQVNTGRTLLSVAGR